MLSIKRYALALFLAAALPAAAGSFVTETAREFSSSGDFNGDGHQDVVVLDRDTGLFRIGYGDSDGDLTFPETRSSGLSNPSALAVGYLESDQRQSLAVTRPESNAIVLVSGLLRDYPGTTSVNEALGTGALAALSFDGDPGPDWEDLFVGLEYEPTGFASAELENQKGLFPLIGASQLSHNGPLRLANPFPAIAGREPWIGAMERLGATSRFLLLDPGPRSLSEFASVPSLHPDSRYAVGFFGRTDMSAAVYVQGSSRIDWHEFDSSISKFGAATVYNLSAPIRVLLTLDIPGGTDRILAIFEESTDAAIFSHTPGSGLVLEQSLDLSGAPGFPSTTTTLPDGGFVAFSGSPGGASNTFQTYAFNGTIHKRTDNGALPPLAGHSAAANLLYFDGEPFVDDDPRLLRAFHFPDWTSDLTFKPSTGLTTLDRESYGGITRGLESPVTVTDTDPPSAATHVIGNQFRPDVSIFSFLDSVGDLVAAPVISPSPGSYDTSVQLNITAANPGDTVYFRTSLDSPFAPFAAPLAFYVNTAVEAYAVASDGRASEVRSASFTFTTPPHLQDSDNDGLPDFVEEDRGLDPTGGSDSDGDGFTDLNELLSNPPYDPNDLNSVPDSRLESMGRFVIKATPRPYNGFADSSTAAALGTPVRVHDISGNLLGEGSTVPAAAGSDTCAQIEVAPITPPQRIVIVTADLHFAANPSHPSGPIGRQLAAVVPVPDPDGSPITFDYDPANPGTQADAWITAARSVADQVEIPTFDITLDVESTLVFALTELTLEHALSFRGLDRSVEMVDLLSAYARPLAPILPFVPNISVIAALEVPFEDSPPFAAPIFRAAELPGTLTTLVHDAPASSPADRLAQFTEDLFRISSTLHFDNPGDFEPPLDALRRFLRQSHPLSPAYTSASTFSAAALVALGTATDSLIQNLPPRPIVTLDVEIPASSDHGTVAQLVGGGQSYCLIDRSGQPFNFPDTFDLLIGSRARIIGFNDLQPAGNLPVIEVIDAQLQSIALPSPDDRDGNLLPDAWELLHFGQTGQAHQESPDGSGLSLLQQYLDGTDPNDASDTGANPPVNFFADNFELSKLSNGDLHATWDWPTAYVDAFELGLLVSESLLSYSDTGLLGHHTVNGTFDLTFPRPTQRRQFYKVFARLK